MPSSPQNSIQTALTNDKDWLSCTGLELASEAMARWNQFRLDMDTSFYFVRGQLTFVEAYGLQGKGYAHDDSQLGSAGEQAQLMTARSNKVQQLARWQLALAVQTKPAFQPVPTNGSFKARSTVTFVKKLLNYELDRRGMAQALILAGESSQYWAEGHVFTQWDFNLGKALTGQPGLEPDVFVPHRTHTGAPRYHVAQLTDVAYDLGGRDSEYPWMIVRTWERKWDLIAKFCGANDGSDPMNPVDPAAEQSKADLAERIMQISPAVDKNKDAYEWNSLEWQRSSFQSKSDFVPVYNLVARQSASLPQGLQAQFLDDDIFLWQGPLPIDRIPVVTIQPARLLGSPFGDSIVQHLSALQRVRNAVISAITSNLLASANPPVVYDPSDNAEPSHLQNLAAIAVTRLANGTLPMPQVVDLLPKNTEVLLKFAEMLDHEMSTLTAINQTVQGAPQPNVSSGNFGALLSTQVLTYNSSFTTALSNAVGAQGDVVMKLYKAFGDRNMEAELAGPGQTFQVEQFTSDDLTDLASVTVQQGNPAARAPAFQLSMIQTLMQSPGSEIKINDLVSFLVSGNYDSLLDDTNDEALSIEEEDEEMLAGQPVQAMMTDRHWIHLPKHILACGSPSIRKDPLKMQAFLAHIQSHIQLDQAMPPNLRLLLGGPQQAVVPPPMPAPPPPQTIPLGQAKIELPNQPKPPGAPPGRLPGIPQPAQPPPPNHGPPHPNA